jgi:hypothetical protein
MFDLFKKWLGWEAEQNVTPPPAVKRDISLEEVKHAISQFTKEKPHGVPLGVLVGQHNEIDYSLLHPYLEGIPTQSYYMSKETYELFEDQEIARQIDHIQRAVDDYVVTAGRLPILDEDLRRKVNYQKLRPYLTIEPTIETYITEHEELITTEEPNIQ